MRLPKNIFLPQVGHSGSEATPLVLNAPSLPLGVSSQCVRLTNTGVPPLCQALLRVLEIQ